MSVLQVILHNLLGFDLVIVLVALGNALCFAVTRRAANELYRKLHRLIFVPSRRENPDALAREISAVDEEEIIALRDITDSAILGKALYTGALDLARCVELGEGRSSK